LDMGSLRHGERVVSMGPCTPARRRRQEKIGNSHPLLS
jgi:hypothetical protein